MSIFQLSLLHQITETRSPQFCEFWLLMAVIRFNQSVQLLFVECSNAAYSRSIRGIITVFYKLCLSQIAFFINLSVLALVYAYIKMQIYSALKTIGYVYYSHMAYACRCNLMIVIHILAYYLVGLFYYL